MMSSWAGLPIVIFGTGGCAKEIKALIDEINGFMYQNIYNLIGFVTNDKSEVGKKIEEVEIFCTNDEFHLLCHKFSSIGVVIGLADPILKKNLRDKIEDMEVSNVVFPNLIHPRANLSQSINNKMGFGNVICSGVNMTVNIKLGNFVLLNRSCNIGHDVVIGDFCTINPNAIISGNVNIGELSLIGAGASIKEKIFVGKQSKVGLGAIVVKDVRELTTVISTAAREMNI
ncbi:UDP-3-O-(3-hydroxymyristoyl)glucosamine N-acyltransferase [Paenibacillus sp. JJ-100]|uniref:hypothetical protein n=1 Tax=Paenibacillus sp. JJ-100 TaxID=2974896 RepID=UPI0022FF5D1A|nr:hypothetical protein [Paenibacillus sp. JJ-100]CAI6086435.1 UDP-3-O-(3-hydroxymyristoyl)glucosamine N-acyltransferase [Paenibacillus sp. JJ-100]